MHAEVRDSRRFTGAVAEPVHAVVVMQHFEFFSFADLVVEFQIGRIVATHAENGTRSFDRVAAPFIGANLAQQLPGFARHAPARGNGDLFDAEDQFVVDNHFDSSLLLCLRHVTR